MNNIHLSNFTSNREIHDTTAQHVTPPEAIEEAQSTPIEQEARGATDIGTTDDGGKVADTALGAATFYAGWGLPVFPLFGLTNGACDCPKGTECGKTSGKHPITSRGFLDATDHQATIQAWYEKWPNANVAVPTGAESGLAVLDIDPRNGGDESLARFEREHGPLPQTLRAFSGGGGRHYYFKCPPDLELGCRTNLLPGIDFKADGGYIITPPSRHVSGGRYAWDPETPPESVDPVAVPESLLRLLAQPANKKKVKKGKPAANSTPESSAPCAGAMIRTACIPEGARNETLFRRGCALRARGVERDAIFEMLLIENNALCVPPMPEDEVRRVADSCSHYAPGIAAVNDERPVVVIGPDERRVNDDALAALTRDPDIYQRGGLLVHVTTARTLAGRMGRSRPAIRVLPPAVLRERLAAQTRFIKWKDGRDGGGLVDAHPPDWMTSAIDAREDWLGIRQLEGIVESPVLRPDGTVLSRPGYDEQTGLLFAPSTSFEIVPATPTLAEARAATIELLEVVKDFPFATEAGRSGWIAALLTVLARHAFTGPAPMFVMDANTPGTGKGLLWQIIARLAEGQALTPTPQPEDDREERKRITSAAIAGERIVCFDNLTRPLGSGPLEAVLTTTRWSDRVLGASKTFAGDVFTVWGATGNNIQFPRRDTIRRIVHVRLETPVEHPESRTTFSHPNLLEWVSAERGRLVAAALTILAAYCAAGRPAVGIPPWGSFEGWSSLVRNCIVWVGLADPAITRAELAAVADTESLAIGELHDGWKDFCAARNLPAGCTAAEALQVLQVDSNDAFLSGRAVQFPALRAALAEAIPGRPNQLPTSRALGAFLRGIRDRVIGGYKLTQGPKQAGTNRWVVVPVGGHQGGGVHAVAPAPGNPPTLPSPPRGHGGHGGHLPSPASPTAAPLGLPAPFPPQVAQTRPLTGSAAPNVHHVPQVHQIGSGPVTQGSVEIATLRRPPALTGAERAEERRASVSLSRAAERADELLEDLASTVRETTGK
jgi:hypothetical protein